MEEFLTRKEEQNQRAKVLQESKEPLLVILADDVSEEIYYDFIKSVLDNFSKLLNSKESREQKKKLLHMIISKITIKLVKRSLLNKLNYKWLFCRLCK